MLSVRQNRYIEEKELTVLPDAAAKLLRFLLTFFILPLPKPRRRKRKTFG